MRDHTDIKKIIEDAERVVFFGGAGVSTDSGIPDFRGSGGLYSEDEEFGYEPEVILCRAFFYGQPELFYRYYRAKMLYPYAEPNRAHEALARLEREGRLSCVITQNIDGLHQLAGSEKVIELHGSVHRNYCENCGEMYTLDYILGSEGVPRCQKCGSLVRPDVVFYGESLDNEAFNRAENAIAAADVLIVGGTSLTVHPAASLVEEFEGEHLIIINKTYTPYDEYAEYVIRESISDVLSEIIE